MDEEQPLTGSSRRERSLLMIPDLFMMWLYYDREEDWRMPPGSVEEAIEQGDITKDEIIIAFHHQIEENF